MLNAAAAATLLRTASAAILFLLCVLLPDVSAATELLLPLTYWIRAFQKKRCDLRFALGDVRSRSTFHSKLE